MAKLDRNLRRSKHSCLLKLLTRFTVLQNVRVHHAVTSLLRILSLVKHSQLPYETFRQNLESTTESKLPPPLLTSLYIFAYKLVTSLRKFLFLFTMSIFLLFFSGRTVGSQNLSDSNLCCFPTIATSQIAGKGQLK